MWKIVAVFLLGLRHGMAPDHVVALNNFIRTRNARLLEAWSYAWRLGGGHLLGMLGSFSLFSLVVRSVSQSIIHWVTLASGLWLILWTIPLWGAIWTKDGHPYRIWMAALTTFKASWLFGIVLGLAIGPSDLALYTLLLKGTISIPTIWLLMDFFVAMLLSLTVMAMILSATCHNVFRSVWRISTGVSGVLSLSLGLWIAIPAFH